MSRVQSIPRLESAQPTPRLESRERFLRKSVLQVDCHEWHGTWEKMGQFWGKFSASTVWKLTPEQLQDPDKATEYF